MKKIVFATLFFVGLSLVGLGLSPPKIAAYNPLNRACADANGNTINNSACKQAENQGSNNPVIEVINTGIKILGWVVGVASVILVMIGGLSLITSAGNPEKIATAKKRIIYALVGVAITALAWAIVTFVTNRIL